MIKSNLHTRSIKCRSKYDQHLELKTYGTYTRQQLFMMVWDEPMSKLGPVLGVSTTLISDACREHHIPVPPRGYWSKVRAGHRAAKPSLPDRPLGMSNIVKLGRPRRTGHEAKTEVYEPLDDVRKRLARAFTQQLLRLPQQKAQFKRSEILWRSLTASVSDFRGQVLVNPDDPSMAVVKVYHQQVAVWIAHSDTYRGSDVNGNGEKPPSFQVCMARKRNSKDIWRTWDALDGLLAEAQLSDIAAEAIVFAELQQRATEALRIEVLSLDQQAPQLEGVQEQKYANLCDQDDANALRVGFLRQAKRYEQAQSLQGLLQAVQRTFPFDDNASIKRWCDLISDEIQSLDPLVDMRFLEILDTAANKRQDFVQAA